MSHDRLYVEAPLATAMPRDGISNYQDESSVQNSRIENSKQDALIPAPATTASNADDDAFDEIQRVVNNNDAHDEIRKTSWVSAFVTFLKALFGVSLLSQPRILGETGLILGTIIHIIIIAVCVFACFLLLKARSMAQIMSSSTDVIEMAYVSLNEDQSKQEQTEQNKNPSSSFVANSLRQFMARQQTSLSGTAFGAKGRLITYADLARQLMGSKMALVISWLIILLHILFASGMYSGAINNLSAFLGWDDEPGPDGSPEGAARLALTALLFPVAAMLLQVSQLKRMFFFSAAGLLLYLVGCVGSMLFSAISFALSNDGHGPDAPNDMWEFKWKGIPVFVASTVYAMEGINLALPTANSLDNDDRRRNPMPLLFAAVVLYGILTLAVAWMGYIGGMGGGPGTMHGKDACHDLSYCLYSESVRSIYQICLSLALLLTLPVILYPSTEMLQIWASEREERKRRLKLGNEDSNPSNEQTQSAHGIPEGDARKPLDAPSTSKMEQHFMLRLTLAMVVCVLGGLEELLSTQMNFVRGIGLSFAGFLLPPLLYIRAREGVGKPLVRRNGKMILALTLLLCFGVFNMVLVCLSAFTERDYGPE